MNSSYQDASLRLIERIRRSTSPCFTVLTAEEDLVKAGFKELPMTSDWGETELSSAFSSGKPAAFYTKLYDTSLYAFVLTPGSRPERKGLSLRVAAAHTDFPCFQVKPSPDMGTEGIHRLNIEDYGGMIKLTWTDRPLSLSGRVVLRGEDPFHPVVRFVDFRRPLLTIPNLAIHMNREINNGKAYNSQTDMIPLLDALWEEAGEDSGRKDAAPEQKTAYFLSLLAEELQVPAGDILDFDLKLYPVEEGCLLGGKESLLSAPRIDNLSSCFACVEALTAARQAAENAALPAEQGSLSVIALFDNEEVGSATKQGAGSSALLRYLEKLYRTIGLDPLALQDDLFDGLMFSVDVAHAAHPNVPGKSDPTNPVRLNGGVVLKQAASQRYVSDCQGVAIAKALCEQAGIPCQTFVNRSDERGGSTLGAIASSFLPMRAVDMGMPILAMHSARELTGVRDYYCMTALLTAFLGNGQ